MNKPSNRGHCNLGRLSVRLRQLVIGRAPNAADASSRSEEKSRRSECQKTQQQRVLNQILPSLIFQESNDEVFHEPKYALKPKLKEGV